MMAAPGERERPTSVRQVGEDLKKAATGQAGKAIDQTKDAGLDVAHAVGDAAEQVADAFTGVPSLAGYIRNAAEQTDSFADSLHDQKAGDLLASATAWGQRQPLMMLAGAALLGAALARIVKAGAEPAGSEDGSGTGASASPVRAPAPPDEERQVELGGRSA
jgi:hypothetical protein